MSAGAITILHLSQLGRKGTELIAPQVEVLERGRREGANALIVGRAFGNKGGKRDVEG